MGRDAQNKQVPHHEALRSSRTSGDRDLKICRLFSLRHLYYERLNIFESKCNLRRAPVSDLVDVLLCFSAFIEPSGVSQANKRKKSHFIPSSCIINPGNTFTPSSVGG